MTFEPALVPAVFDTSPLIFLDRLEYVTRLPRLYHGYITPQVMQELHAKPGAPGSGVPEMGVFQTHTHSPGILETLAGDFSAGSGETSTMAAAIELNAWVVLDDMTARRYAQKRGIQFVGTLGVLLRLHKTKLRLRTLQDDIAMLEAAGMHFSEGIRQKVLDSLLLD